MSFEPEHAGAILLYLACLALTMAGASYLFYKFRTNPFSYVLGLAVFGSVVLVLAVKLAPEKFEILNLASYGVFIGGPLVLLAAHFIARSGKLIASAQFYLLLALLVMAIGVDAFVVEPHWLQTTYMTVKTKKLTRSIKIAVISDIQIDQAGDYERGVLKKVMDEKPDLILMPGDYVQCLTLPKQLAQIAKYRGLIQEVGGLPAPLGTFAVRGNVDMEDWPTIFKGFPITAMDQTTTQDLGPLVVTGLSFDDSFNPTLKLLGQKKFYIIFGHGPDFALARPPADLLVAGHTHGGQVRLPWLGPILTLCRVPRAWAAGRTEIAPGSTLVVSRGVGMERNYAPRLRFLCRPQLVFITLQPDGQSP